MPDANTSFRDYNNSFTQKEENALLDVWALLGEYRDDLILVGGLAPRYITAPQNTRDYSLTHHCGTMDIDLGVSIAVSNQPRYKEIIDILKQAGFKNAVNDKGNLKKHSFVKEENGENIVIDCRQARKMAEKQTHKVAAGIKNYNQIPNFKSSGRFSSWVESRAESLFSFLIPGASSSRMVRKSSGTA